MGQQVHDLVELLKEPLWLDRWSLRVENTPLENGDLAGCAAQPEYRKAHLQFDVEQLETGDELDETVTHEMSHAHTWPLHALAEQQANALVAILPEPLREAFKALLHEDIRLAAEAVTTDVGQTYIRLLRRAWKADADLAEARKELRELKRKTPAA